MSAQDLRPSAPGLSVDIGVAVLYVDVQISPEILPHVPLQTEATGAAGACVANTPNDALSPFGVTIPEFQLKPRIVLTALGRI